MRREREREEGKESYLDGVVLIVWRRCWARQMINLIHFSEQRIDDIVDHELEVGMADPVLDIAPSSCSKQAKE